MVWGENLTVIPHCLQEVIEEMDPGPVVPDGGMRHNKLVFQLVIRGGCGVGMFSTSFINPWNRLHKQLLEYLSSDIC